MGSARQTVKHIIRTMELGYWGFQGLAHPARLLLAYADKEFTDKHYTSREEWAADKATLDSDFPNLPWLKTPEHGTICQSGAIYRYLGSTCNLAGSPKEALQAEIIDGVLQDGWSAFIKLQFNKDAYEGAKAGVHDNIKGKIAQIAKHLSKNKFMAGENVTWVDFKALHFLNVWSHWSADIKADEKVSAYIAAVVATGGDKFQAAWSNTLETMPVFPPFVAWGGMIAMKEMKAETFPTAEA